MSKFFNPLNEPAAKPEKLESNSSLYNDVVGICPKCRQPFGTGIVANDTVYYCVPCRVSQPIPT